MPWTIIISWLVVGSANFYIALKKDLFGVVTYGDALLAMGILVVGAPIMFPIVLFILFEPFFDKPINPPKVATPPPPAPAPAPEKEWYPED